MMRLSLSLKLMAVDRVWNFWFRRTKRYARSNYRGFVVTPANIHDDYLWADSAYSGEHFKDLLSLDGFENRIHEKGAKNHPLSAAGTERNSIRSQNQARVEHIFSCLTTSMKGEFTRKIGLKK